MKPADTSLHRLENIGFRLVGKWTLETDKLQCALTDCASSVNVLYAFVSDGIVCYIGKSVRSLQQRLYGYQNPGATQYTNRKAHQLIRDALTGQATILIYAFVDSGQLRHGEFHVNLAAGLEDDLIATFKPAWNKAGI